MKATKRIFTVLTLALLCVLSTSAYTEVPGISGPTWIDYRMDFSGSGTEENPYVITQPEHLAMLAYNINNDILDLSGCHFILGADIDFSYRKAQDDHLNYVVPSWVPIGKGGYSGSHYTFKGIFSNPHGYVIKNMIIRASGDLGGMDYGLFGHVEGRVDGLRLQNVTIEGVDGDNCGAICGRAGNSSTQASITNCQVENVNIVTNYGTVGGIVGDAYHCVLRNCVVKGSLQGLLCGGIAGCYTDLGFEKDNDDPLSFDNCHSVVDLRGICPDGYNRPSIYMGGIVGFCTGNAHQVIQFCSSSGTIATVGEPRGLSYGGIIGFLQDLNIENCCSSMSISGANVMGGLVGLMAAPSTILSSFANGYIDTTLPDWTKLDLSFRGMYAGGLVGYINNADIENGDVYVGYSLSAGSLVEPQIPDEAREYFGFGIGSIIGNAKNTANFGDTMNGLTVDKNLCGLPAIPTEYGEIANVEYQKTKYLTSDDDPYKSFYKLPIDMLTQYKSQYSQDVAFPDNFMLAAVPFYVKDEHFAHYSVWQVTTKFDITPLAYNRATQKALASFYFQPGEDLSFLKIEEDEESAVKTVTPLDPGKADIVVEYAGLHRTIHLDITYGVPWNDKEPTEFPGGNGAKNDPYIIQNASQLIAVANSEVYNREDMYFRLANDIFFNTHLIQKDETAKADARAWTPVKWHANLDGNGKTLYGLYVNTHVDETYREEDPNYSTIHVKSFDVSGLFSVLYGHVHDMAIVDSYVDMNMVGSTPSSLCAGLYAGLIRGGASIERCLAHGIVLGPRTMCGGFVGHGYELDGERGNISDCFSCVHVMGKDWVNSANTDAGVAGGGISGGWACDHITRCVSVGKVEAFNSRRGIGTTNKNSAEDSKTWYFDKQQMTTEFNATDDDRRGDCTTAEMIQGDIFTDQPAWQHEKGRYPMLRQFANTPYGDILSMPVHFADGDRAGRVTQIFEFPTENVTWAAVGEDTYVDIINECGAATPMSTGFDHIYAETKEDALVSKCTKALRVMQVDPVVTEGTVIGIQFEDPKCEAAWLTAFGKETGDVVTLRNAVTVSKQQAYDFNTKARLNGVETFNEMRYFVGIKNLLAGMLSGISTLSEVQLPKQLEYIDKEAFSGCSSLAEVTLPATTEEVAGGAFDGSAVSDIQVEPRCTAFEVRDHALFTTDNDLWLVAYPPARDEQTVILHGPFHNIMYHAFNKLPQLDEIYIDYPKPEGSAIQMDDEAIVHRNAEEGQLMDIYINDGTFDGHDENYHYETGGNLDGILMKEYLEKSYWQTYANAGRLHRYFPLTVTNALWATMYIGFCTQLPPELKAYVVPKSLNELYEDGETDITLKRVSNLLHHTVPVVIKAEHADTYLLRPYEGTVQNIPMSANKLMGSDIGQNGLYGIPVNQMDIQNEDRVLTLSYNSAGTLGFYGYTGERVPPYKAYLYYNWLSSSPTLLGSLASYGIVIDDTIDDSTTSLNAPPSTLNTQPYYDLSGRRVAQPTKGIYIVGGKKVVK